MEQFQAATNDALTALKTRSVAIMRMTSLAMTSVQIVTFFVQDRTIATFFNDVVTIAAVAASITTEAWACIGSRFWMILASLCIQIAALMFFFVAVAVLQGFLPSKLAMVIACLPLAGSLAAWHQFCAYSQIIRLNQKKR